MKKLINGSKRILSALMVISLVVCMGGCSKKEEAPLRIGVLKGPTGIGAVSLTDSVNKGEYEKYEVTLSAEAPDIVAKLVNGDLDIGALPTNVAVNLYNKTNGDIQVIALNCLNVLYILENGNSINSVSDLRGKTIYCNSKGSNPEYLLNYVLNKNGLVPGQDVFVEFRETNEVVTMMVSGQAEVCLLPVPAVTTVIMKNSNVRKALDMKEEYDRVTDDDSVLTMGCMVATRKYAEEHPDEIKLFLERYQKSIEEVLKNTDDIDAKVVEQGIVGNEQIAKKAIPDCGIVCITGKEIKPALDGFLKVLFEADKASLGGAMPKDDFYYEK